MNITLTQEQQDEYDREGKITLCKPKPPVWSVKKHKYWLGLFDSEVVCGTPNNHVINAGITRETETLAQKLANETHCRNLISAWVDDHGGHTWTKKSFNYSVYRDRENVWRYIMTNSTYTPGLVYMDDEQAEKLTKLLNEHPEKFKVPY